MGDLAAAFVADEIQKPLPGRLNFNDIPNSGEYIFYSDPNKMQTEKKESYLRGELRALNYKEQIAKFNEIKKAKDYQCLITIFDGLPEEGLRHIAKRTRNLDQFPAKNREIYRVDPSVSVISAEDKILSVFNSALPKKSDTIEELKELIKKLLKENYMIVELRFFGDPASGNLSEKLPKQSKIELVRLVTEFLSGVLAIEKQPYPLFLFIIDEDKAGYSTAFPGGKISGFDTIFIPPTERLDTDEACVWYGEMLERIVESEKKAEFSEFFKATLLGNMEIIISETQGYPGSFIRSVCSYTGCNDLAEEILNPK